MATSASKIGTLNAGRFVALALLAFVSFMLLQRNPQIGVFWLFGLAFGFVLQRGRFCFASAFRDLFLLQDGRVMKGILGGLLVATFGFSLVMYNLLPALGMGRIPFNAGVYPVGAHLVLAGLLFGLGMVVAGGCVSGTLYRIGEGYVASLVSLAGIIVGLAFVHHTWNWWWENYISFQPLVWLPNSLGWAGSILATGVAILAVFLLVLWWESKGGGIARVSRADREVMTFKERIDSLRRSVFVWAWPAITAGLVLGVLNFSLYLFERPWGLIGEISRWSEGFLSLVRLPAPVHVGGAGPCSIGGSESISPLTWGLMINVGMIGGSFIAALLAGEFRLRVARQGRRYLQSFGGGTIMGYGAGLAGGCNIGAFFSSVPSLALSGWVFALSLAVGAFLGVQVIKRIS
ncbi:MAG: YeeE/YedE family protein [Chloroflexi bacterium]|nr:YeeE/YedE family protein [Chloroflexota bacterium]